MRENNRRKFNSKYLNNYVYLNTVNAGYNKNHIMERK